MKEKAEGQLAELRKAESSAKHNYNMLPWAGAAFGGSSFLLSFTVCESYIENNFQHFRSTHEDSFCTTAVFIWK